MANSIETRPLDEWFAESLAGDIALCDPFSGEPLNGAHILNPPNRPTQAFVEDYTLGNGYGIWQGGKGLGIQQVGVYLVDPSSTEGLGDRRALEEAVGSFDVMGFAGARSVRLGERLRRTAPGLGSVTVGGEIAPGEDYVGILMETAAKVGTLAVEIDPSRDFFGNPDTKDSRALQAVRDTVISQGLDQKDPSDPDLTYLATDLVYANTLQWHQVMRAGSELEKIYGEYGRMPQSMLLVVPAEHSDVARKIAVSSRLPVQSLPAREEFGSDTDYLSYMFALEKGYIPHEALRGAEF